MNAPPHNDLVDAYLAAIPSDETQKVTANRVGLTRSRMTKIILAREQGDDVRLHPKTAKKIEQETKGLLDRDPVHRARMDGMRQAAEMMEKALDEVRAVIGEDRMRVTPPSNPAAAVGAARRAAEADVDTNDGTARQGQSHEEKAV